MTNHSRRVAFSTGLMMLTLGWAQLAMAAGLPNGTGGAFVPVASSETPYISHGGANVFNVDTVNTHYVIAPIETVQVTGSATFATFIVGYFNGAAQTCNITAYNLYNGNYYSGSGSSGGTVGFSNYLVSLTLPLAGEYALNMYCYLPAQNYNGASYIYGWY
jgi:hypothetical protein